MGTMSVPKVAIRPLIAALILACTSLACGDECSGPADCETQERCSLGKCVPKNRGGVVILPDPDTGPRPVPTRPDALVDSGMMIDAGDVGTTTTSTPTMTMTTADTGVTDGSRLPVPDAGVGYDSGVLTGSAQPNRGLVVLGDLQDPGGIGYNAGAIFRNNGPAQIGVRTYSYSLGTEGQCTVVEQRVLSGTQAGLEATSITVLTGQIHNDPITYFPQGAGRFAPRQSLVTPVLSIGASATFTINSSNQSGTLGPAMMTVRSPPQPAITSIQAGAPFVSLGNGTVTWLPQALMNPPLRMTFEMYDQNHDVVLECTTPDDGEFVIPMEARIAWLTSGPMTPASLEIRYDTDAILQVPVIGGGAVGTVFRASRGQKHPVQ